MKKTKVSIFSVTIINNNNFSGISSYTLDIYNKQGEVINIIDELLNKTTNIRPDSFNEKGNTILEHFPERIEMNL